MGQENLEKQREQIDKIDASIVDLLNQRLTVAHEIGKIKLEFGADFYDPAREAEVFKKLEVLNNGPLNQSALNAIYREVISASIALEKELQVAFLGPEATYTPVSYTHLTLPTKRIV